MENPSTFDTPCTPNVTVAVVETTSRLRSDSANANESQWTGLAPANFTTGANAVVRSTARLHARRLKTMVDLAALADDWNRLAGDVPFRRWDWLVPWWRNYRQASTELFVLAVEDDAGQVIGLAPWYVEPTAGRGRVVRFLGSGEVCSEYLTILSPPGEQPRVARALGEWLCNEGIESWDLIELIGSESGDPGVRALIDEFASREFPIHERAGVNCWSVALPSTWDEFLATLNSPRRAKIRQALRKHFDNHQATTHILTDPAELDYRFEMIVDLHQRRHRGLGQSGCFASRPFTAFHREVSRRFLEMGKLRLMWTELAGRPIAAEYDFVGADTVYYYQTGIEPDAIKLGPGWLGMIGSLKQAIESGYRTFDFLRGDEAYKTSWGARPRATIEARIVARRAAARFRHAIWLARTNVRRWMKQGFHLGQKIAGETD
ncbi:MAG TPA: GNAT family N-acetyltransferase [Pirellulales bacterium]|jgi:CelD/BcsL family acetyltransferase involved in cellulose biosynthesis|nr:GNAT family N-acetyltransferase [Pirellulales bacterium]